MNTLNILCLCGSLRKGSYNAAALAAIQHLAPYTMQINNNFDVGAMPLFNPDLDDPPPFQVDHLLFEIKNTDGLIIASPEYAHGISGVMKNTLDWLVSSIDFPGMPVALINTSPRASHAQLALREVLATMSAHIIEEASINLPLLGSKLGTKGIINDPAMSLSLTFALQSFQEAIIQQQDTQPISASRVKTTA